jgi:hypothetical protein
VPCRCCASHGWPVSRVLAASPLRGPRRKVGRAAFIESYRLVAAVTAVVILASSQLLYAMGIHDSYAGALFESAMATITGSGLTPTTSSARILQVILAVCSVAVFATLAGSLGAFFLRGTDPSPHLRTANPTYPNG